QIYRAGIELFRDGEPIDLVTLGDQLQKQGVLERVGGRAHLAMLVEQTPTAANVEYYGRIVKGHAYKRALISAGGEVTALGYNEALEAEEALNSAQARVFSIAEQRTGTGMERIYDLLKPAMDRIDAQMASGGGVVGVPSGFHELDRVTNGFKASDMIVIAGRPSMGKALALDTPIPTPEGWTTMGELGVGARVLDEEGTPCRVTHATPVQLGRECYRVVFSDGSSVVADADHLWTTSSEPEPGRTPRFRVVTTLQVRGSLRTSGGVPAHHLPAPAVSAHPVASGAWVGTACAETARWIEAVEPVPSVPVRCVQVDSATRLYLAGRGRVPTHNTSFVLNITLHAAIEHKLPVAIFSLEMSKEQLVERMLCEQARIDAQRLHRGMLSEREHEQLVYSLGPLGDAPIFIDDTPMLDDLTLRLKARQASARDNVGLIIVDYLQLMHGRSVANDANRVQEVSQISRSMKAIARELRVPIIACSQLSRAPEQRPDKRPILSDLRESGSIEQDADLVMFLYRDDYYNREKSEKPGVAEVIIAKHRNGPTGSIDLRFIRELTRFENIDRRHSDFEIEQ
ncbi:MAG: replicative DNA helicase, partial [Candidatus Dormibacteraeota bacterium]|nr:replicative DNA helicase [Candidatus Dormibacteraeota bacterium]